MGRTIAQSLIDLFIASPHAVNGTQIDSAWWCQIACWPPDVFAVTSLLLGDSGTYRLAVSPPPGQRWPPRKHWNRDVRAASEEWWKWIAAGAPGQCPPPLVRLGALIEANQATAVHDIGYHWDLACARLELHALADEASAGFGVPASREDAEEDPDWIVYRHDANELLASSGSLSKVSPRIMRILPKLRTPQAGISLRSLSAHLAATRLGEVDVKWAHAPTFEDGKASFNLLLLPIPMQIVPGNFVPATGRLDNMDRRFGFFRFEPAPLDQNLLHDVIQRAKACAGGVDGVVLPELALSESELDAVKVMLEKAFPSPERVPFLLSGVRKDRANIAHFACCEPSRRVWRDFAQSKHHRWALDRGQILNYQIGAALHPSIKWWEDIDVQQRELHYILVNSWLGICPLICEDLARQDPVAQIIRSLGPTLVIALLLDGPQLVGRWPARYATVLADDPGSSVLTFTPLGMCERSKPPGASPKRVVGLWKDARNGVKELDLEVGSSGLLLTLCNEWAHEWMADGRSDEGCAAQLYLGHVEQVRVP